MPLMSRAASKWLWSQRDNQQLAIGPSQANLEPLSDGGLGLAICPWRDENSG